MVIRFRLAVDLEKLVSVAISYAVAMSQVPLHSIKVWSRKPLKDTDFIMCEKKCFVGYSESTYVKGEYTMAFLVG